jgi:hypothetical protein
LCDLQIENRGSRVERHHGQRPFLFPAAGVAHYLLAGTDSAAQSGAFVK